MTKYLRFCAVLVLLPLFAGCVSTTLPGVRSAIQANIDSHEISGAVTVVATKDKILDVEAVGLSDIASNKPMQPNSLFWIASMTKPVTGVAVMMLQDEGKLNVSDPVAKYIPEFANLKTPSGKPANLTIAQIMTHTSGLSDGDADARRKAHTLADVIPIYLASPMQYEPGEKWSYCQSGINTAARIVEIASGMSFDKFVQLRILNPLGMNHTTFYPSERPDLHLVTAYARDSATGELKAVPPRTDFGPKDRPPYGNGGLYSTGPDYARFCQMLLGGGVYGGKRFLSPDAMKYLTTVQTGELPTGFFQSKEYGEHGTNYGWGIGICILLAPHPWVPPLPRRPGSVGTHPTRGPTAMLSPGTFGHGGAWGTQAWMDPQRGVAYVLMVQRSNFANSDASNVRRDFQQAASDALARSGK